MVTESRFKLPDVTQHVILRGHQREACFYTERDYVRCLDALRQAAFRHQVSIHAYVLMPDHIQLLLSQAKANGIVSMLQDTQCRYEQHINTDYRASGAPWKVRYKAIMVDSEDYLLSCMRYIEMNPVRAGRVEFPLYYPWSSYHSNATGRYDPMLVPHAVYEDLGGSRVQRQFAYRKLFDCEQINLELHHKREAINQELALEQSTQRRSRSTLSGRPASGGTGSDCVFL